METPAYDFEEAYHQWGRIPVDDFGYFDALHLLQLTKSQLLELVDLATIVRMNTDQYRNLGGTLLDFMRPSAYAGKVVMDYGCGLGLDSLVYAEQRCGIVLADIHPNTVFLAQQVLCHKTGHIPHAVVINLAQHPWFLLPTGVQPALIWSLGVLHHTPHMKDILKRMVDVAPEVRTLVYSDKTWERNIGEAMPDFPIWEHPRYMEYVRKQDAVGTWATCWNEATIKALVDDFAEVTECTYVGDGQFLGVAMRAKQ